MNILYLDPYSNTSYSRQYLYYEGLYNSLIKTNNVYLYRDLIVDYNEIKRDIPFTPDIIIFGLSWFGKHKYFKKIKNLECPSICFIFKPSIHLKEKLEFCKINQVDLILTPHSQFEDFSGMAGIPAKLFPYGFDPSIFKPRNLEKKYEKFKSNVKEKSDDINSINSEAYELYLRGNYIYETKECL